MMKISQKILRNSTFAFIAAISVFFVACEAETSPEAIIENGCDDKIEELEKIIRMNEVEIQMLYSSFDTIEQNLDNINSKQGDLNAIKTAGSAKSQKQRIAENFMQIAKSIETNQKIVASLRSQLANSKNAEKLEKMIAVLEKTIQDKNKEIVVLRTEMAKLSGMIAEKDFVIAKQTSEITQKDEKISQIEKDKTELQSKVQKGFVLVASRDDLLEDKIARKGASAGTFKKKELDLLPNFPTSKFKEIANIYANNNILLGEKDRTFYVVSKHPTDSYSIKDYDPDATFKDPRKYIVITDVEKFWSQTKYLVVEVR